jgi:Holliday junction resolvase
MGGRASKQKGNRFERECVERAIAKGLQAKRAWGSNGGALGEHEEVDILFTVGAFKWKAQAKVRKQMPGLLRPTEHVDIQVVKEDRGETFVVLKYDAFLDLLRLQQIADKVTA